MVGEVPEEVTKAFTAKLAGSTRSVLETRACSTNSECVAIDFVFNYLVAICYGALVVLARVGNVTISVCHFVWRSGYHLAQRAVQTIQPARDVPGRAAFFLPE
jgi:hypothetical protein